MSFLSSLLVFSALFSLVVASPTSQPGHGVSIPQVFENCAGAPRPHLPDQSDSISGYAPQLPSSGSGWEEWVFVVEGSINGENPLFFARFARGDPAEANSTLDHGLLAFWTNFDNGTTFAFAIPGTLNYSDVGGVKTWSLANNKLVFDGNTGSWSHSIVTPSGFSFQSRMDIPPPGAPFNPVTNGQPGLLRNDLHARVEIPRGDFHGNVTFPWGETHTNFKGLVTLKHVWSTKPISDSVDSYIRGITYLPETPSIQTMQWYQTFQDGKEVDAAQYTKQMGSPKQIYVIDQITNSPDLQIKTDSNFNSVVTLPGCREQGGTPHITWSTNYIRKRYTFTDSAGGNTSFHSITITANQYYKGKWYPVSNAGVGFLETYDSPKH